MVTGALDRSVQVWHLPDGQAVGEPWRLAAPVSPRSLVFSPDGKRLFVGAADGLARVWEPGVTASAGLTLAHRGAVLAVAFSPDGSRLATACADGCARLWDGTSGRMIGSVMRHGAAVQAIAFSADGTLFASGSGDSRVQVWNGRTGRRLGRGFQTRAPPTALAFSPDGRMLATGGHNGRLKLWDAATGDPIGEGSRYPGAVTCLAFTESGTGLVAGGGPEGWIRRWSLKGLATSLSPDQLALRSQVETRRRVGPDGEIQTIPSAEWKVLAHRLAVLEREGRAHAAGNQRT
jgi:WD40 repeat protein